MTSSVPSRPPRPSRGPRALRAVPAAAPDPSRADPRLVLRASDPQDLVAAAWVALGFEPTESVVLLTFGAGPSFHARADLPPARASRQHVEDLVAVLLEPAVRHAVQRVAVVLCSADVARTDPLAGALAASFEAVGIEVVAQVRYAAGRVHRLDVPGAPDPDDPGEPCDPSSHAFLVRAVLAGHVVAGSRADVERLVAPDPARALAVRAALLDAAGAIGPEADEAVDVVDLVRTLAAARTVPAARDVAVLLRLLGDPVQAQRAWCPRSRVEARAHADLWASVVRASPEESVASAAGLLALAAAYAGDGALAWCAVDRAQAAQPGHRLTALIGRHLAAATRPEAYAPAAR
ncbi:DUF4192 domain-containing protein [Nocardioides sp. TRM66260-LWL]|uniref:DUF4192 family protein n=1 Tax=Nocardioides sp. TRM66260-LWL TaxID=2874478 RepID=UPI001CC7848A|nr:DUF4192 family protein [Nocardioides sp. TRM66260-LWL]MBZ5733711.1 DUF4192 domain-containing protein [Nocardioides sp. TRM66260-LWL]